MRRPVRFPSSILTLATWGLLHSAGGAGEEPIDFARDIQPILKTRCLACHNGIKRAGGLRLVTNSDVFEAADSGLRPVVAGQPDRSELLRRVETADPAERMPADGDPLSNDQIERLRRWIVQGAEWPRHWAFRPAESSGMPESADTWSRGPVDRFVSTRLRESGISPSPAADPYTLIRRLHLDLGGLPPIPDEADAFVADPAPDAYERIVDRLLASPRFGERWGRHWLDVARYADTDGYEVDGSRPNAWYYRDWVIRAINRDLPYDRFTIEQLAGDLLPGAGLEQHLATAFHRQTLTNKEGGADAEEYRVEAVIDRVNTTAAVWLGLTTACTQCHDHPYEPVTQREFYGLFAFFNNADESQYRVPTAGEDEYQRRKAEHERKLGELRGQLDSARAEEREQLETSIRDYEKRAPRDPAVLLEVMAEREVARTTQMFNRGNFLQPIRDVVVEPDVIAVLHEFQPRDSAASAAQIPDRLDLAEWLVDPANPLTARVAVNGVWQHLCGEGLVRTPDDFGLSGDPPTHPELLDWLAVEFMGQGTGIRRQGSEVKNQGSEVDNADTTDYGPRTTATPSVPASRLAWSRKRLIRQIVTSAAYRQSSRQRPEVAGLDPRNELLHRQNRFRVEAETVGDLHLATGGLLAERIGGPSVFPPFPAELAQIDFRSDLQWPTSTGPDRYRRGMYTFFKRTLPHPNLTTFDCPLAESTAVKRPRSNTPLHALVTLNNEVFVDAARAFAARVLGDEAGDEEERIAFAFRLAVTRPPTDGERSLLIDLVRDHRNWYAEHPEDARRLVGDENVGADSLSVTAAWTAIASVILNLDEFITRE